ncbi:hypothetical protein ACHWQZ_G002967 [Mnemiopsis leidyi]
MRRVLPADVYGGDIPCWDKFCDNDDGSRIACDTELKRCKIRDGAAVCLESYGRTKPSPTLRCKQTFLQNCQCVHGGLNDWGARCQCQLSPDAKTTFVVLAVVVIVMLVLGLVIARWCMKKRQELVLSMIAKQKQLEQNEKERGDSGENSNPKNLPTTRPVGKQFSAANLLAAHGGRTSKRNVLQGHPGGHCTPISPLPGVRENNVPLPRSMRMSDPAKSASIMKPQDKALSASTESLLRAPRDKALSASTESLLRAPRDKALSVSADSLLRAPRDKALSVSADSLLRAPRDKALSVSVESLLGAPQCKALSVSAESLQRAPSPSPGYRRKKLLLEQANTASADKTGVEFEHSEVFTPQPNSETTKAKHQPTEEATEAKLEKQASTAHSNSGSLSASGEQDTKLPSSGYRRKKRQNADTDREK